jgi:hypothetical protein
MADTWSDPIVAWSDVAEQVEALRQLEPSKDDDR